MCFDAQASLEVIPFDTHTKPRNHEKPEWFLVSWFRGFRGFVLAAFQPAEPPSAAACGFFHGLVRFIPVGWPKPAGSGHLDVAIFQTLPTMSIGHPQYVYQLLSISVELVLA
jgi:hypothetical protein